MRNPDGTERIVLNAALCDENRDISWLKDVLKAKVRVVPEIRIIDRNTADKKVYQFDKNRKRMNFFNLR